MHCLADTLNMDSSLNERSQCLSILQNICNIQSDKLFQIWGIIGHTNIDEKIKTLCKRMDQRLNELIVEEAHREYNLALKIEKKLKEAAKLCTELGTSYENLTAKLEDRSIPLLQVEKILDERLQKCRDCKEDRLRRYKELLHEEQNICNTLMIPKRQKFLRVPRESDLEDFAVYIAQKVAEERDCKRKFEQLKQDVIKITSELKCSPHSSFHKMVLTDRNLSFTKENMTRLNDLYVFLIECSEKAKEESTDLRNKLSTMWNKLGVDLEIREMFLEKYADHSMATVGALKAELQHCEDKRRQCIKSIVDDLRINLSEWWDKICFGKKQRRKFKPFFIDCFTEDLVDLHVLEIEKMKKYYVENSEILLLAQRLNLLWKKLTELHEKGNDPKRLFANRGGRLLKEEKERRTIQKDIPIVEKQIKSMLDAYEEKFGEPFTYNDENLRDAIKEYRIVFQKQRQQLKETRNRCKEHSCLHLFTPTPKRILPRPITPSTIPRKIIKTKNSSAIRSAKSAVTTPPRNRFRRLCCRSDK